VRFSGRISRVRFIAAVSLIVSLHASAYNYTSLDVVGNGLATFEEVLILPEPKQCFFCRTPLSAALAQAGDVCGHAQCQWKLSHLPEHATCRICRRPLAPQQMGTRLCSTSCLRAATTAHRAHAHQQECAIIEQGTALRDQGAAALNIPQPDAYPVTLVPAYSARVTNLPERRRRAFRDHLARLLSQATEHRSVVREESTELVPPTNDLGNAAIAAVVGKVCTNCQGACCQNGGTHAYLTVEVLRRYLEAHPSQHPREVLTAYMEAMGWRTYENSCVFHTTGGCALSRAMRSDTCNDFFCAGLTAFQQEQSTTGTVRGFFVSAENGHVRAAAFIDEMENRRIPLPLAGTGG
jgi:hypothetical protein